MTPAEREAALDEIRDSNSRGSKTHEILADDDDGLDVPF